MKAYLKLERQEVPNYEASGLWRTMRLSAKEHGYRSALWFGLVCLKDHRLLNVWAQTTPWNRLRVSMQRHRGVTIGRDVHLGTNVNLDLPYPYFIIIEDGVSLAGNVTILAHNKPLKYHRNCSPSYIAPVIVHRNAWVAVNVTILPGVEIGEGAIVASNSLVNKDIPPMTLCGGTPAKFIKDLSDKLRDNYPPDVFEKILKERKEKYGI